MPTNRNQETVAVVSARLAGQEVAVYYYHHDACLSVRGLEFNDFGETVKGALLARVPAITLRDAHPVISENGYQTWLAKQRVRPGHPVNYMYAELRGHVVPSTDVGVPNGAARVSFRPPARPDFHCAETQRRFLGAEQVLIVGKEIWAQNPVWANG